MTLDVGTRLGPYDIVRLIGAGGMGEVYEARDTRLDRTIAIKVLLKAYSADPERRARFEREAKTIAGLNHPHICTLHDVGEYGPTEGQPATLYLVMEYVTGETLAQRLRRGPLTLRKALTVTMELAEALAAAHRQGIVHRDLKPANVMLTTTGVILLDFGVAKLKGVGEQPLDAMLSSAPTGSSPLTGAGMIVGTVQYMAPEQLQGKDSDARADVWALGAMIYEMVTGQQAFAGENQASVVAAVLEREPIPLSTLQPMAPPTLDLLVRRCLAKTPDRRWDSAHDLAEAVRWMRDASAAGALTTPPSPAADRRMQRLTRLGLLLLAFLLGAALTLWISARWRPFISSAPVIRAELAVRPAETVDAGGIASVWNPTPGGSRTALTWTPDGGSLVFVGRRGAAQQLYVRALQGAEAIPLAGTEAAQVPAVSPDGQWVAFWSPNSVKRMPLGGGPVMDLVSGMEHPPTGLVWDARGGLFFGKTMGEIWHVSPGDVPIQVTTLGDKERVHIPSSLLPGDEVLLYTTRKRDVTFGDEDVVAFQLATRQRKVLVHDAVDARYVPTGHLVFLRRGMLFAVPFDARQLKVEGEPVPLMEGVAQALSGAHPGNITGAGQFAFATNGHLAWIPGAVVPGRDAWLVTVDRTGRVSKLGAPVRSYVPIVRMSPDGRSVVVIVSTLTEMGLWLFDVGRGLLTPLHRGGEASWPLWSPDGQRLLFRWLNEGQFSLAWLAADGSAPPVALMRSGDFQQSSWAPDGALLGVTGDDLAVATLEKASGRIEPLRRTDAVEYWPEISPDGRWLAYGSDASGRMEIFVQPYPGRGTGTLMSSEGGSSPAWHPAGRELFYVTPGDAQGRRRMMSVAFDAGAPARVAQPRVLFEFDALSLAGFSCIPTRCYDVAPDGHRFYAIQVGGPPLRPVVTHINLVQNWFEELKAKAPAGGK